MPIQVNASLYPTLVLVLGTETVTIREENRAERGIKVGHTDKRERKRHSETSLVFPSKDGRLPQAA